MVQLRDFGARVSPRRPAFVLFSLAFLAASLVTLILGVVPGPAHDGLISLRNDLPGIDFLAAAETAPTPPDYTSAYVPLLASDKPAPPPPTPTPTPTPVEPSSPAGLTLWGGGDSLSVYMNYHLIALSHEYGMTPLHNCTTGATKDQSCVTSSSLRNPSWYDWPLALASVVANLDPDVMVFMIGANEATSMDGYAFGSDGWRQAYGALVGQVMDSIRGDGRYVIWVGQPNARYNSDPAFDSKMATINSVFAEQAAMRSDVAFVDTYALFGGADFSAFAQYRAVDGLHFTSAGGRYLAEEVMRTLIAMMDARRATAQEGSRLERPDQIR